MAPPPVSTNGDTILTAGILKEGSLTITVPSYGVNIHRYECGAAASRELLIIPEIIVVAFDRDPVLRLNRYPAMTPPDFVGSSLIPQRWSAS
jgi:hypothetical protein